MRLLLLCLFMFWPVFVHAHDLSTVIEQVISGQHAVDPSHSEDLPEETEGPSEDEPTMVDLPIVTLRSLDKISARTGTFQATVGSTVKFGSLYVKARACRKSSPLESPESAAFLQIWEIDQNGEAQWVFSGWMFASSPGLSSMDHPIYDVWVLGCQDKKSAVSTIDSQEHETRGEGEVKDDRVLDRPDAIED